MDSIRITYIYTVISDYFQGLGSIFQDLKVLRTVILEMQSQNFYYPLIMAKECSSKVKKVAYALYSDGTGTKCRQGSEEGK